MNSNFENYFKKGHKIAIYLGIISAILMFLSLLNVNSNEIKSIQLNNSNSLIPRSSVAMNYTNGSGNGWYMENGTGSIKFVNSTCINITTPVGQPSTWGVIYQDCPRINRTIQPNTLYRTIIPVNNPIVQNSQYGIVLFESNTSAYFFDIDRYDGLINLEYSISSARTVAYSAPLAPSYSQICLQVAYYNGQLNASYSYDMVTFNSLLTNFSPSITLNFIGLFSAENYTNFLINPGTSVSFYNFYFRNRSLEFHIRKYSHCNRYKSNQRSNLLL
jgi:hypothetical protein